MRISDWSSDVCSSDLSRPRSCCTWPLLPPAWSAASSGSPASTWRWRRCCWPWYWCSARPASSSTPSPPPWARTSTNCDHEPAHGAVLRRQLGRGLDDLLLGLVDRGGAVRGRDHRAELAPTRYKIGR